MNLSIQVEVHCHWVAVRLHAVVVFISLQFFDTVVLVAGRSCLEETVPVLFWNKWSKNIEGNLANSGSPGCDTKIEVVVVVLIFAEFWPSPKSGVVWWIACVVFVYMQFCGRFVLRQALLMNVVVWCLLTGYRTSQVWDISAFSSPTQQCRSSGRATKDKSTGCTSASTSQYCLRHVLHTITYQCHRVRRMYSLCQIQNLFRIRHSVVRKG